MVRPKESRLGLLRGSHDDVYGHQIFDLVIVLCPLRARQRVWRIGAEFRWVSIVKGIILLSQGKAGAADAGGVGLQTPGVGWEGQV